MAASAVAAAAGIGTDGPVNPGRPRKGRNSAALWGTGKASQPSRCFVFYEVDGDVAISLGSRNRSRCTRSPRRKPTLGPRERLDRYTAGIALRPARRPCRDISQ